MLTSIFQSPKYHLPIARYDDDLYIFLDQLFKDYLNDLKTVVGLTSEDVKKAEQLCQKILLSIKNAYEGRQDRAYANLQKGLDIIEGQLIFETLNGDEPNNFYRIRMGNNMEYCTNDMFHIPFQLRHLINSYRYSIPGHPSLYLGSSSFVCWNELRRPNFDEVQIASYKVKKGTSLKILDFGFRPQDVQWIEEHVQTEPMENLRIQFESLDQIKSYLVIWPLIASCSIKVKNEGSTFKPEYIIPQLLCQWIRKDKDVFGVKYFSVSTTYAYYNNCNPIEYVHNYVFPSQSFKFSGYCDELSNYFLMSKPVIWGLCDSFQMIHPVVDKNFDQIEIMKDIKVAYQHTKFWTIEQILLNKNHETIDR